MSQASVAKVNVDELKRIGIVVQKQKDYFLIRLKTVGGDLTAEELNAIARIADRFGNGDVHLTTRQGVEIQNVHSDDLDAARKELERNGIVLGACGPRGRGIVACPGNAICTSGIIETKGLSEDLDSLYFRKEAPHKFKIGISGCPNNCSKPVENDVGVMGGMLPGWDKNTCVSCRLCVNICPVQAINRKGTDYVLDEETCIYCGLCVRNCPATAWTARKTGYTLYLGGTMGKKPRLGTRARALIESKDELIGTISRAFEFYRAQGRKKERFGHTLDRIGVDKAFSEIFNEDIAFPGLDKKEERKPEDRKTIDLRGICCPMNFVRAKLAIEPLTPGERIEFFLDEGEPIVNVTRSLKDEGHKVLKVIPEDRYFKVLVEKNEGRA